jgi:hypothetical protein
MLALMSVQLALLALYSKMAKVVLRLIPISAWVVEHALQLALRVQCATTTLVCPIKAKSYKQSLQSLL